MLYGLLNLSLWGYVIATLILTQITIATVTVFLHRSQAHRALDVHPVLSHFFRFWLWLTTGMVTKTWVAIHRKHHAKCETKDDPHSPQILGLKKVLLEGAELYRSAAKDSEMIERYGFGAPDGWLERHIYSKHSGKGVILMLLIDLLLFGIPGITIWAIQMMWIPFFAAGVINGIGHYWGYRNFECPDAARNIMPLAIFIGGEELHNNHHTFGSSAKLSVKPWEFDIGWLYIRVLQFFGLAKVRRLPPQLCKVPGKRQVDAETVNAVLKNRFQVMAKYSQEVLLPLLQEERRKAGETSRNLFCRAKALLIREHSLVGVEDKKRLEQLLKARKPLEQAYHYRLKLQEIWSKTTATKNELVEALQEWCRQAEASGIETLKQFAHTMKTFGTKQVVVDAA